MALRSFNELTVWQRSMELVEDCHDISLQLPAYERYALADQIRRSSMSIPSNIAEGCKRNNRKEYRYFLGISNGSAGELETQLLILERLYPKIDVSKALQLMTEVQKMLYVLMDKLNPTPYTLHSDNEL